MANQDVDAISEGPNTIYIRRKLNFGQTSRIESEAVLAGQGKGNLVLTLMEVYMDRWEGPAFQGISSVAEMDPDEPVVERAHDEIARRYGERIGRKSPDPN